MLFGYADVGSYGLGHSLLAWARCHIWCQRNNIPMLAPSWLHIKHRVGPFLRGERDDRLYHRLFCFDDYIKGWRRLWLLNILPHLSADHHDLSSWMKSAEKGVVVFRNQSQLNEETYFSEVVGHGHMLRSALEKMTCAEFRPSNNFNSHIALHIRMGDFGKPLSIDELRAGRKNSSIPVEWFVYILMCLRERLGDVRAIVYSDGDDLSLTKLLCLPNVSRAPQQSSVTDMLSISRATILISSGSGFSMWGSFLGDVPRICFPGQRFVRVLGEPADIDYEPEVDFANELPANFTDAILKRIHGRF
jgi:hypothetical protein